MPSSFNLNLSAIRWREPRVIARLILGVLLLANVVAAIVAFKPFGGSVEDLTAERNQLRQQLAKARNRLTSSKEIAEKMTTARKQDDDFIVKYITDRRITASVIAAELNDIAKQAGVKPGEMSNQEDAVEGSNDLGRLTIQAAFQGNYPNVVKLVNLLDKSSHFLIIDAMNAQPQPSTGVLNVTFKIYTFVRNVPDGELS